MSYYCNVPAWSHSGALGPEHWHEHFPAAKGDLQSPIALYSDSPVKACDLQLNGYNSATELTAVNMGSTVYFTNDCAKMANPPIYVNGVHGWWEKYSFNHFHMHWGETSADGSEHTIDDKRFPMELHLVHCLGNLSLAQACNRPKGLAVLGFMYKITHEDNPAYTPLLDAIKHVKYKGEEKQVQEGESLSLASLLPSSLDSGYFYYSGSLTTPPCSEVVQWMVFSDPISISEKQISIFRTLHRCSGHGCVENMSGNWRPLQPLKGRDVFQSKKVNAQLNKEPY
ncbi:Car15 [Bugula neritina]|uniref:Carbonic anhydrase n=1 Tax=Bugula neritina TaxID=10212 RepID=A0A7J7J137_BUGNE|nr:Car15 [Bugula neritina]